MLPWGSSLEHRADANRWWLFRWMWRHWRRWVLPLQNFEFEIDAVRSELDQLKKKKFLNKEKEGILEKCHTLMAKTESAFGRCFPRELFIWQCCFAFVKMFFDSSTSGTVFKMRSSQETSWPVSSA